MKPKMGHAPAVSPKKGGELRLSGFALLDLMQAVLAKGMSFRFRASGWSMTPFIHDGDLITVAPLQNHHPRLGEVVAFIHPESKKLVVHRVIAKKGDHFFIQGDADHNYPDGYLPVSNLVGRVTHLWRAGKRVRYGLGPERTLIAYLSRKGWLRPLRDRLAALRKTFSRGQN